MWLGCNRKPTAPTERTKRRSTRYDEGMKPKTLSQAKNLMRRALKDLVEGVPGLAEQQRLREHFKHCCAYCGGPAGPRDGHIDHADHDGGNSLGNLLLACKTCNGDEKREKSWRMFLEEKCGQDPAVLAQRHQAIDAWRAAHPIQPRSPTPEVTAALAEADRAIEAFAQAYATVRRARAATTTK